MTTTCSFVAATPLGFGAVGNAIPTYYVKPDNEDYFSATGAFKYSTNTCSFLQGTISTGGFIVRTTSTSTATIRPYITQAGKPGTVGCDVLSASPVTHNSLKTYNGIKCSTAWNELDGLYTLMFADNIPYNAKYGGVVSDVFSVKPVTTVTITSSQVQTTTSTLAPEPATTTTISLATSTSTEYHILPPTPYSTATESPYLSTLTETWTLTPPPWTTSTM